MLPAILGGAVVGLGMFGSILKASNPTEYAKNFDWEHYDEKNPRFYSEELKSADNPEGWNQGLFNEAMVEYHKLLPLY